MLELRGPLLAGSEGFANARLWDLSWPENFGPWKSVGPRRRSHRSIAMGVASTLSADRKPTSNEFCGVHVPRHCLIAFLAVVTAPLVEEIVYRGILYSALQRLTGAIAAVAIVTLIFAGLHVRQYWPNFGAISAIPLLSLALTVVRARTGRLLPCYMIHLVFNGIQSVLIVAEPYLRSVIETPQPEAAPAIIHFLTRFL